MSAWPYTPAVSDLAIPGDEQHDTRQLAIADVRLHKRVDLRQRRGATPSRSGSRRGKRPAAIAPVRANSPSTRHRAQNGLRIRESPVERQRESLAEAALWKSNLTNQSCDRRRSVMPLIIGEKSARETEPQRERAASMFSGGPGRPRSSRKSWICLERASCWPPATNAPDLLQCRRFRAGLPELGRKRLRWMVSMPSQPRPQPHPRASLGHGGHPGRGIDRRIDRHRSVAAEAGQARRWHRAARRSLPVARHSRTCTSTTIDLPQRRSGRWSVDHRLHAIGPDQRGRPRRRPASQKSAALMTDVGSTKATIVSNWTASCHTRCITSAAIPWPAAKRRGLARQWPGSSRDRRSRRHAR